MLLQELDSVAVEEAALPVIEQMKQKRELQCQELEPLCAELEAEARAVADKLGDADATVESAKESGLLGMQQQLGQLTEQLKLLLTKRTQRAQDLFEMQISLLQKLERAEEADAICIEERLQAQGCFTEVGLQGLQKEADELNQQLLQRTALVGELMGQIRTEWELIGYTRISGNQLEEAIATHDVGALGLSDNTVQSLQEKALQISEIKVIRQEEVANIHARLQASWTAVHKLFGLGDETSDETKASAEELNGLDVEGGAPNFIAQHSSLRVCDSQACEEKLKVLRRVLVEREKPVREALRSIYKETHSTMDQLEFFFMTVDECDCVVKRSELLEAQVSEMGALKESLQPLLESISEREALLTKARTFEEAAENSAGRFKGSSLHFIEEEKFRKQFTKRYPRIVATLRKEIANWEETQDKVFMYDGTVYRDVLEAEDTDRLTLDLKKVGQKTKAPSRQTASSIMRKSGTTPTKTSRKTTKSETTKENQSVADAEVAQSPRLAASKRVRSMRESKSSLRTKSSEDLRVSVEDIRESNPDLRASNESTESVPLSLDDLEDCTAVESPRKLRKSLTPTNKVRKSLGGDDIANVLGAAGEMQIDKGEGCEKMDTEDDEVVIKAAKPKGKKVQSVTPRSTGAVSRIKTPTARRSTWRKKA